jgi:cytoskeletal protein RodZ
MIKWIIGLVLVVVAAGAIWWSGILNPYLSMGSAQQQATTTPEQTQQETSSAPQSDLPTASNDTSDAAVAQDAAAVDAQIKALSSDSSNLDSDLNDKPVSQEF